MGTNCLGLPLYGRSDQYDLCVRLKYKNEVTVAMIPSLRRADASPRAAVALLPDWVDLLQQTLILLGDLAPLETLQTTGGKRRPIVKKGETLNQGRMPAPLAAYESSADRSGILFVSLRKKWQFGRLMFSSQASGRTGAKRAQVQLGNQLFFCSSSSQLHSLELLLKRQLQGFLHQHLSRVTLLRRWCSSPTGRRCWRILTLWITAAQQCLSLITTYPPLLFHLLFLLPLLFLSVRSHKAVITKADVTELKPPPSERPHTFDFYPLVMKTESLSPTSTISTSLRSYCAFDPSVAVVGVRRLLDWGT